MNRYVDWGKADWRQSDAQIAADLGCKLPTVKKRRKKQEDPDGSCKKRDFSRKAPPLTLRLESELYGAVEFLGAVAGNFQKTVYVSDVLRALVIQGISRLKETFPEEQEALELFLKGKDAQAAEKLAARLERQIEDLRDERILLGNKPVTWALVIEERLKEAGLDRSHREAYRRLARIKRTNNLRPFKFRLQAAAAKGHGRIGVEVYAPAKDWDARCELAFEAEGGDGRPLLLGSDIAEAEGDFLQGLPKEASPRELFEGLFGDMDVMVSLRPTIEDDRVREKDCDEKAFWNFCRSKDGGR